MQVDQVHSGPEAHPPSRSYADYDYVVKLMLLGAAGVGKTSIICQYMRSVFPENLKSTLGFDISVKTIHSQEKVVKLQIWDTAGQERFRAMSERNFKGTDCFILVFDIAERDSLSEVDYYLEKIQENTPNSFRVLCGNKADLEQKRQITREEGMKMAEVHGMSYFEFSAKEDPQKVSDLFQFMADKTAKKFKENPTLSTYQRRASSSHICLEPEMILPINLKKKKSCCR